VLIRAVTITPYELEISGTESEAPAASSRRGTSCRAQGLVHVALRGPQRGPGLRAGSQAQHRGRGALPGQLVGDGGGREGQLGRGAEVLLLAGRAEVLHRARGREAEQYAHRQQDQQHQLGAHLEPGEQRDARAIRHR
jgi:hypothetical protein